MAEMNDIVRLAVDGYKGNVEKYSTRQSQDVLRQALIDMNGGKTTLDYRNIRDGKCQGLFTLIEEILDNTVNEGLSEDDFFNSMADYRNVALGDSPVFLVEDDDLYVVAEAADGTQGIRRQRLSGLSETTIPTKMHYVRIYEELSRVLAGRVDFNYMIDRVAESFRQQMLNEIYGVWSSVTAEDLGGDVYATAGAFDEEALLDIIAHVEASANGQTATILGTKKALRALKDYLPSDEINSDLYNMGYAGKFYGSPIVAIPQRHKIGTTEFVMDDTVLTIVAGAEKPIKVVNEGDPIIITRDPAFNADLTYEYFYGARWGAGIVLASNTGAGIGRYELTT